MGSKYANPMSTSAPPLWERWGVPTRLPAPARRWARAALPSLRPPRDQARRAETDAALLVAEAIPRLQHVGYKGSIPNRCLPGGITPLSARVHEAHHAIA